MPVTGFTQQAGRGIKGVMEGKGCFGGNRRMMEEAGLYDDNVKMLEEKLAVEGKTPLFLPVTAYCSALLPWQTG